MGGIGKTTLAKGIYHQQEIILTVLLEFIYLNSSQQGKSGSKYYSNLFQLLIKREKISKQTDDEVAKNLYQVQLERKCLVILDDIWEEEAWGPPEPCLPIRYGRHR